MAFISVLATANVVCSCLGNDGQDIVYYDDSAITAFSLGTLNIVKDTVTKSGADSTYTTTLDCSSYRFTIDQERALIYNLDSLPYGVDATKVLATISSKNSGVIALKNVNSDTLRLYSSADSIDFSQPRHFYVYSTDATVHRDYTVTVNVHKQKPNVLTWNSTPITNALFRALKGMKAVVMGGSVFVFGNDGLRTKVFRTPESNPAAWVEADSITMLESNAYAGACALNNRLYVLSGGKLLSSSNGDSWEEVSTPAISRLIGASSARLYGYAAGGGIMSSADGGVTWTANKLDTGAGLLPSEHVNLVTLPLLTNKNAYRVVLVGTGSSGSRVWGKIEENDAQAENQSWAYYNPTAENEFEVPNLANLQAIRYDGSVFALGGDSIGKAGSEAFKYFYRSYDAGLTWHTDTTYTLPTGFSSSHEVFTMVADSKNYLWIICGSTGQVWRGAKNKLVWAEEKRYFTE